jgi:hypothetical protein
MSTVSEQIHRVKPNKAQREQIQNEALSRAINPLGTFSNYPAIIQGFLAKGIAESEIKPRENCFTFNAWRALGRTVKRGEHGVRVVTFRHEDYKEEKPDGTIEFKIKSRPWYATVFHVSQTEAMTGGAK